jgi:hypothetical protein
MAGLVPAIYVLSGKKTWMLGTAPGMTTRYLFGLHQDVVSGLRNSGHRSRS